MVRGILSGLLWAVDTVVLAIMLERLSGNPEAAITAPLIATFLHDFISSIFMLIFMFVRDRCKELISVIGRKEAGIVMLAAILGGPVGMSLYIASIGFVGAPMTAVVSSLYPAFGAFFSFVFLKEKRKAYQIAALLGAVMATILLGYTSGGALRGSRLGILTGLGCAVAWASEAVICTYALRSSDMSSETALQLRQLSSGLIYGIVIINIIRGWGITMDILRGSLIYIVVAAAFFGTASYLFYYSSLKAVGAAKTMALNITYSGFAVLIGWLILRELPGIRSLILGAVIVICSLVSAYDKE